MAKSLTEIEVPKALQIAQSLLGKNKSSILLDSDLIEGSCTVLTKQQFTKKTGITKNPLDVVIDESCLVLNYSKTILHCYFADNAKCCNWVCTYFSDIAEANKVRKAFNRQYSTTPDEPNCWINRSNDVFICLFFDDEINSFVLGFMTVTPDAKLIDRALNSGNHVLN
jgi:hypothetical protein